MVKRYIVNRGDRVGHDRYRLTERCNTDDIVDRGEADEAEWLDLVSEGFKECQHCCRPTDPEREAVTA